MLIRQRLMTSIYLHFRDQWLMLERIGSRVIHDGLYTGAAGGHFEKDELGNPAACVLRELREETGLTEENLKNLQLRYICMRNKAGELRINHYFFADLKTFPQGIRSNEGNLVWVQEKELSSLPMPYSAKQAINHYLAEGRNMDALYIGMKTAEGMIFQAMVEDAE